MKSMRLFSRGCQVSAVLAFLAFLPGAFAADAGTNAMADTGAKGVRAAAQTNAVAAAANSAPAELEVPVAVFDLTILPTKDPFFPLSTRKPVPDATNAAPAFSASSFVLKALDGPANSRLAMINNRTFAVGDSNMLTTPSGKIGVRVLQIKDASVVLRIDSQSDPIEIFLRKSAQ